MNKSLVTHTLRTAGSSARVWASVQLPVAYPVPQKVGATTITKASDALINIGANTSGITFATS